MPEAQLRATVTDNYISGIGPVGSIAQNGIQFGYGATGVIKDNRVFANAYTGPNWASTGILIFQSSGILVQGNEVKDSQVGIAIETWGCFAGGPAAASNIHIVYNRISGAQWGVSIAAYSYAPYSECDAEANGTKITNNSIRGVPGVGEQGIFIGGSVIAGTFTPEVDRNRATSNYIVGFDTPVEVDGATNTVLNANGNDA